MRLTIITSLGLLVTAVLTLAGVSLGGAPSGRARVPLIISGAPILNPSRTVVIDGPIGRGNILALGPTLLSFLDDKSKPVDLVISSPGGELRTGFFFLDILDHIREEGLTVRCYVPTMVASMAFQIFLHCDQRYALAHSYLLWHGVRVMGSGSEPLTAKKADELAQDLHKANEGILEDLREGLGPFLSEEQIMFHFMHETMHTAQGLDRIAPGFMHVYKSIPGLLEALSSTTAPRSPFIRLETPFDWQYSTVRGTTTPPPDTGTLPAPAPALPDNVRQAVHNICEVAVPPGKVEECTDKVEECLISSHTEPEFKTCAGKAITELRKVRG